MRPERVLVRDLLRRRARPLSLGCAASIAHQACEALVPLTIGLAIDHAVGEPSLLPIALAVAGTLALFTVLATGGGVAYWILTAAGQREAHELRVRVLGQILADPRTGRERTAGELLAILTSDTVSVSNVLRAVAYAISGAAGLAVTVVVLLRIDLGLGLGLVVVVPLLMVGIDRIGPWLEEKVQAQQQTAGLAAAFAAEIFQALRPLRGFGGLTEASRRYHRASRLSLATALDTASAAAVVTGVGLVAMALVVAGTAAVAGQMAFSGRITVGEFVTVVAMASFVAEPVLRIAAAVQQLAVSRASAARLAPLLPPSTAAAVVGLRSRTDVDPAVRSLRLRDVTLGPIADVDLDLAPGEMLGIVTTDPSVAEALTALLRGDREAGAGRMWLGEVDTAVLEGRRVRRAVLVEPHTAHLLGGTVAAALDTGRATQVEQVEQALTAATVADVSGDLMDNGANLSGGQRQRLALARALTADPPVLVLRDPLTAVDAVTEDAVAVRIHALRRSKGRSTMVISTSPPLLAQCDRVVYLDGVGDPVIGTHAELLRAAGYAQAVLR